MVLPGKLLKRKTGPADACLLCSAIPPLSSQEKTQLSSLNSYGMAASFSTQTKRKKQIGSQRLCWSLNPDQPQLASRLYFCEEKIRTKLLRFLRISVAHNKHNSHLIKCTFRLKISSEIWKEKMDVWKLTMNKPVYFCLIVTFLNQNTCLF